MTLRLFRRICPKVSCCRKRQIRCLDVSIAPATARKTDCGSSKTIALDSPRAGVSRASIAALTMVATLFICSATQAAISFKGHVFPYNFEGDGTDPGENIYFYPDLEVLNYSIDVGNSIHSGELVINGGSRVYGDQVHTSIGTTGNGKVLVRGLGSTLESLVSIGGAHRFDPRLPDHNGNGTLIIEAGGKVVSSNLTVFPPSVNRCAIGIGSMSIGEVAVNGATWEISNSYLEIGDGGMGRLMVDNGRVHNTDNAYLAVRPGSTGNVVLAGTGAEWRSRGKIFIGGDGVTPGGNGTLELQGGTVEVEELAIMSSANGRGQLRGNGYVEGLFGAAGTSSVDPKGLRNSGVITAEGDYLNPPASRPGVSGQGQLWFDGNYVQEPNGTLELTISHVNRTTASVPKIPVRIEAKAKLDGKLRVSQAGDLLLDEGDRFHLMEWDSFNGRFREFSGSTIQNRRDIFFGLNYTEKGLELITLKTPRTLSDVLEAPTATNLLVLPPGLPGKPPSSSQSQLFVQALAQLSPESWDVLTMDWEEYGDEPMGSVPNNWFDDPFANQPRDRHEAARIVHEIGESTAFWMRENQLDGYKFVHVVTASGGTWFADGFTDRLKALGFSGGVQLTILDGYHTTAVQVTGDGQLTHEEIGDTADYVENYFHQGFGIEGAGALLNHAVNINLTGLDPQYASVDRLIPNLSAHFFPSQWYLHSVIDPNALSTHEYGFKRSVAALGALPAKVIGKGTFNDLAFADPIAVRKPYEGSRVVDVYQGNIATTTTVDVRTGKVIVFSEVPLVASDTGTVEVTEEGELRLETQSPAIATLFIDLEQDANFFEFDIDFQTQSTGLLSIWIDGNQALLIDESLLAQLRDPINTGLLPLPEYLEAGMHTMIVRLDPGIDSSSEVLLSNLAFSQLVIIPEPSSLVILVLGFLVTFHRRAFAVHGPHRLH